MSASLRRRKTEQPQQPPFEVLEWLQKWSRVERDGEWYRHAVVRRRDGELRIFLIRNDHPLALAA